LLMNNNNIFHKNYPNEHNNNVHYKVLNDHDHMDKMYDVFVRMINYFDNSIGSVDDEMMMNEYDEMMMNDDDSSKEIDQNMIL
jgi:hypothetical protein